MTRASSTTLFLLFAETIAAANLIAASPSKGSELPARRAIHHLAGRMDVFRPVHVYRDFGWGGNADFIPSGWMGDTGNLEIDEQWTDGAEDETCILINYRGTDWAGIYWQRPENNWGKSSPRSGRDLRPARKLKLRAKAHQKDCTVEIGMAGIDGPYGDSSQKRSKPLRLTAQWQDYEVDLGGMDLKHIVGGFLVVFKDSASICLDNIRYDTDRPVEATRLVPSYLVTRRSALYPVNNNAAHLYDNALIMIAFSCEARNGKASPEDKRDSSNRLRILADATLASLQHDRAFTDGRLRNAYWGGGDFLDHTGHVRLPGWYDRNQRQWLEDRYCVSSYTGNLAWAALGLLEASHTLEPQKADGKYLLACQQIMSWIDKNTRESDELGGFSGGVEGWEANDSHPGGPERIQWRSTEHNLDVLAVAKRLAVITKDERWGGMAAHAARFLKHTFNAEGSHFWTGTLPSGQINQNTIPLDCQTWAVLAASDKATDRRALDWAEQHLASTVSWADGNEVRGYAYGTAQKGIWPEGTAQMGLACLHAGLRDKGREIRDALRRIQASGPGTDGQGIVASCTEKIATGFNDQFYYRELHTGATAWFYLLEMRYNPFTGEIIGEDWKD